MKTPQPCSLIKSKNKSEANPSPRMPFKIGLTVLALCMGEVLAQAAAPPAPQGSITAKVFLNIGGGTAVTDLTGNSKFPNNPDIVAYPTYFELWGWSVADINTPPPSDNFNSYGSQILGYFYPATTGDYVFYLASDDGGALYLSTDDNPANKKLIAQETGWSNPRSYTTVGGGSTLEDKNSQTFAGTQWPVKDTSNGGAKITLTQGKGYYIEALEKEGGGGDNLSVSIDGSLPIPGSMLATFDKTSGTVAIVTQPQPLTVNEGQSASFSVVLNGTPPYTYQWMRSGSPVTDATNSSYTIARAYRADNGSKYKVAVTGAQGNATSTEVSLTVVNDATPPTLSAASSSPTFDSVTVQFSEPVDGATATNAANYKIDNGVTVNGATQLAPPGSTGDNTVILTTSKQPAGSTPTLTVNNVKDAVGNVIAANSTITFKTFVFSTGWATYQRWENDTKNIDDFGTALDDGSQGPPTVDTAVAQFDGPWGVADNYNSLHFAWFVAPFTGGYVFFVAADDAANLYLSTDDTPANKKLIAQESGWSNEYQWQTVGGGSDPANKRSDTFGSSQWPTPNIINLTAGNKYYIEILHHEGGGGDGDGATFIKAGDPDPAQSAAGLNLKGNVIGTYLDPSGASLNITQQPANATGVDGKTTGTDGRPVTFSVSATGTSKYGSIVAYQWQQAPPGGSTFTNIPGASQSFYRPPLLSLTDTGTKFQVIASVPTLSVTSTVATLTVIADTFPPVPSAGAITRSDGVVEVGVGFDEAVNPAGLVAGNFSLVGGGTISKFNLTTNSYGDYSAVVLDVTGLTAGTTYQVNVKNVADLKGNAIPAAGVNASFKLGNVGWANSGTPMRPGQVVPVAADGFDILNGGRQEWTSYDEITFAYVQKTNDFDVKVQVVYAEPGSEWTRVGLMARNALDVGEPSDDRNGTSTASAYAQTHVNPNQTLGSSGRFDATLTSNNTPNNGHEQNQRLTMGGATSGWGSPATAPVYPDVWLRLARSGPTLHGYRSTDGVNWTDQGTTTLTDQQPNMYVGPFLAVETGNIWASAVFDVWGTTFDPTYARLFVAEFRNYGDVPSAITSPTISISKSGTAWQITYTGSLLSSPTVNGTYTAVSGATSPYTIPPGTGTIFYRASQ